jgi:hypothetical protein
MSIEFYGLADAVGLEPEQRATVQRLLDVRRRVSGRNGMLQAYYDGNVRVKDFGVTIESKVLENDFVCHWPEKAVTSLSEREIFDSFVFEDGYTDQALDAALRDNNLASAYQRYNESKLTHGVMFACVNSWDGRPQVRFHSAETAWAEPDGNYDSGEVGAGIAVARYGRVPWSGKRVIPVQVNLYERGFVTQIHLYAQNKWRAEVYRLPHGECMMYAFVHKSTGTQPFGQSRITKAVRSITRAAVRTTWHMELSGAFYAMPKYAALGLTDSQFQSMVKNKPKFYLDSMMLFTRDKQGNVPNIQQFSGNSPQPFIDELEYYAGQFCGASGVPMSSLVDTGHYTSSDAMAAADNGLVRLAKKDIAADTGTLRKMALMMMAVSHNCTVDELTDEQKTVTAHFLDPDMPSRSQLADSTLKNINAFPWLASTDLALERMGFDHSDIIRVAKARDEYEASQSLSALLERANALPADEGGVG